MVCILPSHLAITLCMWNSFSTHSEYWLFVISISSCGKISLCKLSPGRYLFWLFTARQLEHITSKCWRADLGDTLIYTPFYGDNLHDGRFWLPNITFLILVNPWCLFSLFNPKFYFPNHISFFTKYTIDNIFLIWIKGVIEQIH